MLTLNKMKTVLTISGFDPTSGAGVIADAEAIRAADCHPLCIVSALTIQDSSNIQAIQAIPVSELQKTLDCLQKDFPIHAIKIGMVASNEQLEWLEALANASQIPIVFDPILAAGGGYTWHPEEDFIRFRALAKASTVSTPNATEQKLLMLKGSILTTDTGSREEVVCKLEHDGTSVLWSRPRIKKTFHGTGCTLASYLAAMLAQGYDLTDAAQKSFYFTHQALQNDYEIGHGQSFFKRQIPFLNSNHHD